jgi:L-fucono-1,5-lactonase
MTAAIDAHQHFWRIVRGDYGWLTPALGTIYRDFEEHDLAPHLARHGIARTILVQAAPSEAETDYLVSVARRSAFVAGVVGWIDFEAPDAPDRVAARALDRVVKGLRPMLQDIDDAAWVLRPGLAPSFRAMRALGLRFDALVKPHHLPHLVRLADRHPGLAIVIDHGAKPDIAHWQPCDDAFRSWTRHLLALASHGCYVKLSGLLTEAGRNRTVEALQPYVDVLFELFLPERVMWGSDWPVVELAGGYDAWRAAALRLTAGLSAAERDDVYGAAAACFYGLDAD